MRRISRIRSYDAPVSEPAASVAGAEPRRWHAALAYALLGRVPEGLSPTDGLDIARFLRELDALWPGGLRAVRSEIGRRRSVGPWPHRVPPELMRGLGAAQFTAALTGVRQELGLDVVTTRRPAERRLDPDERRLLTDVPPHHGG
jgi:hypothetical protein